MGRGGHLGTLKEFKQQLNRVVREKHLSLPRWYEKKRPALKHWSVNSE